MPDLADRTDSSAADPSALETTSTARLAGAVDLARAAAVEAADGEVAQVGEHLRVDAEPDPGAATHLFSAVKPGYRGWCWAVTLAEPAALPDDAGPTVSEVVLLPGPDAVTPPAWVPWNERVRAEDLSPGDLLPVDPGDERLVPAHAAIDDDVDGSAADTDQVRAVGDELAFGRPRVMSPEGRLDAGVRWSGGDFGPGAQMARSASAHCGTCGFYLALSGSLRAAFGVCGNGNVPADGRVVHVEYGCGGHSELEIDTGSAVAVAELVYDDGIEMETG